MRWTRFIITFIAILAPTLVGGLAAYKLSAEQTPLYRSSVTVLVIQGHAGAFDPSSAVRSAEKVAENLVKVVPTESFLRQVLSSGLGVEEDLIGTLNVRRAAWRDMASATSDGSLVTVTAMNSDRQVAARAVAASAFVLRNRSQLWHGAGEAINVRTVDPPVTTPEPVTPQVEVNTIAGTLVGLLLGSAAVYYTRAFFRQRQSAEPELADLHPSPNNRAAKVEAPPGLEVSRQSHPTSYNGNGQPKPGLPDWPSGTMTDANSAESRIKMCLVAGAQGNGSNSLMKRFGTSLSSATAKLVKRAS